MCRTKGILQTLCARGDVNKALDLLDGLPAPLPSPAYVSIFKACCHHKTLSAAKRLQAHLAHHRVPLSGPVGDHLVLALAKLGSLEDAQLASAASLSVFSCTSLIAAYVEHDRYQEALWIYEWMIENHIAPNNYTYVSLFKACGLIPDLTSGMLFHSEAIQKGLATDVFACNTLVSMYGKCNALAEAEYVFEAMQERTAVSWNAMLAAFVEHGNGKEALETYAQMQHEYVEADHCTYVITIQACAVLAEKELEGPLTKVMTLEIGQALHSDARKRGIMSDVFIGSTLVSMYGKSRAIVEAEHAFGALVQPTIVPWNAMLAAYVEQDQGEQTLQLYMHLRDKAVVLDQTSYVVVLQACASLADKEAGLDARGLKRMSLQIGQALHAETVLRGFTSLVFVGNTLLGMYGKCGAVAEAELVFSTSERTIMSWNAMLSVFIEQNLPEKALLLYMQMQEEAIMVDERTLIMVLLACIGLGEKEEAISLDGQSVKAMALEVGQALHAHVCAIGFSGDPFVGSTLIMMYGMCGVIGGADYVFNALSVQDLAAWNSMLSACVEQGLGERALLLYRQMQDEGVPPNERTFVVCIQGCTLMTDKISALSVEEPTTPAIPFLIGQALHADARRMGFAHDVFVGNALIGMYGKCRATMEAEGVFDALSERDIVSWNAIISAHVDHGQEERALWLHRLMDKNKVTCAMLMRMLQVCSATGSLDLCKQLHFEIVAAGFDQVGSVLATLISAYGGCSSIDDADEVLSGAMDPDIASWNAFMTGHSGEGNVVASLQTFEFMKVVGLTADGVSFIEALSACSHSGLVEEGLGYFDSMTKDYGLSPETKHLGCLLDLLGRAGDFGRIEYVLEKIAITDVTFWLGLLGACTKGNVELGERAFYNMLKLHPRESAAYILMANIYADAGLRACAAEVEKDCICGG